MKSYNLNEVYYLKTNNEFISDEIIKNNKTPTKYLIINSLSNTHDVILLPVYQDKHIRKLKKSGIAPETGVGNSKFLKFLIDREIADFNFIFFGLIGLHYEAVLFLKNYLLSIVNKSNKTFILIDYSPHNTESLVTLSES